MERFCNVGSVRKVRSFFPVSWVLNNSVLVPCKIRLRKSLFPELFRVTKNTKFMEVHRNILTFPQWGKTFIAVIQPSTIH